MNSRLIAAAALAVAGLVCWSAPAGADLNFKDGMWRVEVNNDFGVHQGSRDRSGDYSINGIVEYEIPATSRVTLGLRLMPLFIYNQDEEKDYRVFRRVFDDNGYDGDTVWGGGFGIGGRIYQVKDEYRGWFAEAGVNALLHANEFNGNNSNLNFISGIGVGYQFKSDWHVQLHYQHISNASLGSENSGANSLGLGLGYRF